MDFGGGPVFFGRDSGLMCRGLQANGVNSRAVMLGDRRPDDEDDLLRVTLGDLENPDWWHSQDLEGVLLYAWGSPRFRKVATAIREAGVTLVLNQDSSGWISPLAGWQGWWGEQRILSGAGAARGGWWNFSRQVMKGLSVGLLRTDPLRAAHLREGDRIACVTPEATEVYRRLCRIYGGEDLADRVVTLPHPVNPIFHPDGRSKEKRVVAVGRWDASIQKRPALLLAAIRLLLDRDAEVQFDIVGNLIPDFDKWRASLPEEWRARVFFHGRLESRKLVEIYRRAQVVYCPSSFESFHIASGEGLSCGCTVVAMDSHCLPGLRWFAGEGDGRLATADDAEGHASALTAELAAWAKGNRDTTAISSRWMGHLHAPNIARRMLADFNPALT